jgi:hypothetical protein
MANQIKEYVNARWQENSTKMGLVKLLGGALILLFPQYTEIIGAIFIATGFQGTALPDKSETK